MADHDELIFLRDASLEPKVAALIAGIAPHPDRLFVEPHADPADPEFKLAIYLYAASPAQLDEWVAEVRRRLADELDLDADAAPTASELEDLELANAGRRS